MIFVLYQNLKEMDVFGHNCIRQDFHEILDFICKKTKKQTNLNKNERKKIKYFEF